MPRATIKFIISLLIVTLAYANRKIPWWSIEAAQKQGPNVCAVEVNDDLNYSYYTECKYWNPRKICGKQTFIKYECCAGYYRVPGYAGCVGVKPLIDLVETARRVGATKFAKLIERSAFADELRRGPPVTLFAPSDEAFDDYLRVKGIRPEWLYEDGRYANLVINHIVDKRIMSSQWEANSLIPSRLHGHVLRINKFSSGMETINCHRVIRKDQPAINGIVHVIDGVLDPVLAQNSDIIDLVARDGRFGVFIKAFENSELGNRIRVSEIPHTIFAPTDAAFSSIPREQLTAMLSDPGSLNALVAHHVVPHPVCIPNIISEQHETTMQRQKLTFDCGSTGPLLEHTVLRNEMFQGTNGLLYILDHVLLPDRAKSVLELAKEEGSHTFLQIIRTAGLEETLSQLKHFTIFVPSETAMYSLSDRQLTQLQTSRESARQFVLNHIVKGRYLTSEIYSNQVATTFDQGIPLRFQVYRGTFGIENALILKADREGSNGILHLISHVLHPAEKSLEYILRADGNFSIWLDAMERIKEIHPQLYHEFKRANSSCTYFVPSDEAFRRLGEDKLQTLMGDTNYLTRTLKNHIADNMLLSESFKPELQYAVKTKQNTVNVVRKDDRVLVNDAALVKYDILNKDGVAHEINAVLLPNQCVRSYQRRRDGTIRKICS